MTQQPKWLIVLSDKTEHWVTDEVYHAVCDAATSGARLVKINATQVINPAHILRMEQEEVPIDRAYRIESHAEKLIVREPQARQEVLDKIREMLKHKTIGAFPLVERKYE